MSSEYLTARRATAGGFLSVAVGALALNAFVAAGAPAAKVAEVTNGPINAEVIEFAGVGSSATTETANQITGEPYETAAIRPLVEAGKMVKPGGTSYFLTIDRTVSST